MFYVCNRYIADRINISQSCIVICIYISRVNLHPITFIRIYLFEREGGCDWSTLECDECKATAVNTSFCFN